MSDNLPRIIAFLGGLLGLGVATTVLFNIVINQDWNASPFIILLAIGNLLVVISALKPFKIPNSFLIWAVIGFLQAYFVYLGRFTIGLFLLPQVLLLLVAAFWGIIYNKKDRPVKEATYIDPPLTKQLNGEEEILSTLTSRERQVLILITQGKSNKDIAKFLVVSQNTVRHHVHQILKKLNCSSRGEASALAIKAGLRPNDLPRS
ncbi:MAG: response regulator transcription factor [Chloroflexota bacterium]|nr:MAG: hypothetical protein KatS3mg045_0970 [Bellilinea sp.]